MELLNFDKLTLTLEASAEHAANWLQHYTRDVDKLARGDDGKLRLFLQPAKPLTQSPPGGTLALTMEGNFLKIASGDLGGSLPIILFELVPLAPEQVEITIAYRHPLAQPYLASLLKEMVSRWRVASASLPKSPFPWRQRLGLPTPEPSSAQQPEPMDSALKKPSEQIPPVSEFAYDVFVSYSHKDREWVHSELLPRLKGAGLKVCIDSESYQPGEPFELGTLGITSIETAVLASRKTTCVFSPAYLESEWCELEDVLAAALDPSARKKRLVPILLHPCQRPLHIRARWYADFTAPGAHERAWDKLLAALSSDKVAGTRAAVLASHAHGGAYADVEGGSKKTADHERVAERDELEVKRRTPRQTVAYRDVIVLQHEITRCFLSSDSISYKHPKSSGQQVVIARAERDSNDRWVVKGPYGTPEKYREGNSVRNGDIVRLEHENTSRNLHSHPGYPSPVTPQQEVTAYQTGQIGDTSDNWRVQTDGGKYWRKGFRVKLIHNATGRPLHSHQGHILKMDALEAQEVTCFPGTDDNDYWRVVEINPGAVSDSQGPATCHITRGDSGMMDDQTIRGFERYFQDPSMDTSEAMKPPLTGELPLRGDACRNIRTALGILGYGDGNGDTYDEALRDLVRQFQRDYHHRSKDGYVGPGTRRLLVTVLIRKGETHHFMRWPDPTNRLEYLKKLRQKLIAHFNESELKTLCSDLGINYESLPDSGLENKARELIWYLERRSRTGELVQECQKERPQVSWV
jgi:hypothetical protein